MDNSPPAAPRKPRPLTDIEAIKDPIERAREAEAFLTYARHQATRGIEIRDAALRAAKAAGHSRPEIARQAQINEHTVKAVLR